MRYARPTGATGHDALTQSKCARCAFAENMPGVQSRRSVRPLITPVIKLDETQEANVASDCNQNTEENTIGIYEVHNIFIRSIPTWEIAYRME